MRMCALSNRIREKPNWWEKIKDPALVEKWTQEVLDQQKDEYRIRQLTRKMVNTQIEVRWHLILLVLPHKRYVVRLDLTNVSGGPTP